MKNVLTLDEFQRLTGVSDAALLWALKNNLFALSYSAENGLSVDIDSVDVKDLVRALASKKEEILAQESGVLTEKITNIISNNLEQLVDRALTQIAFK